MSGQFSQPHSRPSALAMCAGWSERIEKGEVPQQQPPPAGVEPT